MIILLGERYFVLDDYDMSQVAIIIQHGDDTVIHKIFVLDEHRNTALFRPLMDVIGVDTLDVLMVQIPFLHPALSAGIGRTLECEHLKACAKYGNGVFCILVSNFNQLLNTAVSIGGLQELP